jgi:predicted transcriptional regulator
VFGWFLFLVETQSMKSKTQAAVNMLSVRLTEEEATRLEELALEAERTKSSIAKRASRDYLDRLEIQLDAQREISKLIEEKVSAGAGK